MNKINTYDIFENKSIFQYFVVVFLFSGLVLACTIGLLYNLESKDYLKRIEKEEQLNLKFLDSLITSNLEVIYSDLLYLSKQNELLQFINSKTDNNNNKYKAWIASEYLELSRRKGLYDQIRYIDEAGMEVVRVNFNNGDPEIVEQSRLQNKGSRYYFKDTIALGPNEIFVSPLDLNVENGEIEKPHKPMIRFGVTVFDNENKKCGVIILNYLAGNLIDLVKDSSRSSPGDVMLVNSDGFWIHSPVKDDAWGFMIKTRENRKFSSSFPKIWNQVLSSDIGQIDNENGLFTSTSIYPLRKRSSSGVVLAPEDKEGKIESKEYFWKIISQIPVYKVKSGTKGLLLKLILMALFLFLMAGIPSIIIAKVLSSRNTQQAELEFRAMSEASSDAVIITNSMNKAVFWNAATETMLGYTANEIQKIDMNNLFVPEDFWVSVCEGQNKYIGSINELSALKNNGDSFPVEVTVSSFKQDDGWYRVASVRDITVRKQIEIQSRTAQEELQLIFDSSQVGIVFMDQNYEILRVNQRMADILGYGSPKGISGRNIANLHLNLKQLNELSEFFNTGILQGKQSRIEFELLKKDQTTVWCSISGKTVDTADPTNLAKGMIWVVEDIAEQRVARLEREEASQMISSSISYAVNIQASILPSNAMLKEVLSSFFVLWEPRDRVGGDMYYMKPWGLGKIIALGDCTGHGVPGAFMTMIANGAMEEAILETPPGDCATCLKRMHQLIQKTLKQKDESGKADDGLDLGLCYIPPRSKNIIFAGAKFSLYSVEDGEVSEIKGDRSSIGYQGVSSSPSFTNHQIKTDTMRSYYMTSDGYIDQVGGAKRRILGKKRFRELLLDMETLPMEERRDRLSEVLRDHQGAEQRRDDVSVIGFTIVPQGPKRKKPADKP